MSRPILRKLALSATAFITASCAQPGRAADTTVSAEALVDAIGVNTHLNYSDSDYNKFPQVLAALRYLGIRNLRDAAPFRAYPNQGNYAKAAQLQYRFCFVTQPNEPLPIKIKAMEAFERAYPGSIAAIEGINEINNRKSLTYRGLNGNQAALAFQSDLYDAVRSSPVLRNVPIYNFTGPPLNGKADFSNYHPYPKQGQQPLGPLTREFRSQQTAMPGKPSVITEAGYHTLVAYPGRWIGVDERTAGRLSLTILFDALQLGIPRVYFYQLLDAYSDAANSNMEKHIGMFDHAFRPKAFATAIHNLIGAIRTPSVGTVAATAPPRVIAANPDVMAVKVKRPRGSWGVILYRRAPLWDVANRRAIELAPVPVDIAFAGERSVARYDLLGSGAAERGIVANKVTVPVGSDPVLVIMDGAA